jgi:hypothetical protein
MAAPRRSVNTQELVMPGQPIFMLPADASSTSSSARAFGAGEEAKSCERQQVGKATDNASNDNCK